MHDRYIFHAILNKCPLARVLCNGMNVAQELFIRLSQLWIVGKCKCFMRRSKSTTHMDCLQLDSWVADELLECSQLAERFQKSDAPSLVDSIMYAESLDSLQPEYGTSFPYSTWK